MHAVVLRPARADLHPATGLAGHAPTLTLATEAGPVLVATRPHAGPNALVYFGGNAEDVALSPPGLAAAFPDHALYLLHYRGYGGSAGTPSEAALFMDSVALFDLVQRAHGSVVAVGRSLGSGVAVHLASVRPVTRLVLATPCDSIEAIAAQRFPRLPVRWLLRDKFESSHYAAQVSAPTRPIAAEHDELIPRANTLALRDAFRPGVASLEVIAGAGHNTIADRQAYGPAPGAPR